MVCEICPHHCKLSEGQRGLCRARVCNRGRIVCDNYGKITSMALDPIEKKPLYRFLPGSYILSVGSFGCNLKCPFCQNHEISMCGPEAEYREMRPEELVSYASNVKDNIGLAFTYNEPLIGWEYVYDTSRLAREAGLETVLVSNGYIETKPLESLLPFVSAMNIDLKAFTEGFYKMVGGDLETVKRSIATAAKSCHVEITTLIIPGENDSVEEMEALSGWLSGVSPDIPLHITRFFPRYKMSDKLPTDAEDLHTLAEAARKTLKYVYLGNV